MTVRSTRLSYEYCAPLVYVEPTAQLEAVNTPFLKEPTCLEARHSDWGLMNTMSKYGKVFTSHAVTTWHNKGLILYLVA